MPPHIKQSVRTGPSPTNPCLLVVNCSKWHQYLPLLLSELKSCIDAILWNQPAWPGDQGATPILSERHCNLAEITIW